jgi:hypothetical protein
LVSTVLHQELGEPPTVIDRLEQVVAHGALLTEGARAHPEPELPPAPQDYRPAPPPVPSPPAHAPRPSKDRMPKQLWLFGILLFLQAMPLSAQLYFEFGVRGFELGFNAVRILVAASVVLLWVRRSWAWRVLLAVQGVALPLLAIVPLID